MHIWQLSHRPLVCLHCHSSESPPLVFKGLWFVCSLSLQIPNGHFHVILFFFCNPYASFSTLGCLSCATHASQKQRGCPIALGTRSSGSKVAFVTVFTNTRWTDHYTSMLRISPLPQVAFALAKVSAEWRTRWAFTHVKSKCWALRDWIFHCRSSQSNFSLRCAGYSSKEQYYISLNET